MDLEKCLHICKTLRDEFDKNNQHRMASLSMGVLCVEPANTEDVQSVLFVADKLLYESKRRGKNQITSKKI